MSNDIETRQLSFHFKGKPKAVSELELNVPQGSIYGFLGPNGAGKSTTIRLLAGLLYPANGSISLFGNNLIKNRIKALLNSAFMIEEPMFYKHLTGKENLVILCNAGGYNKNRIEEALKRVQLYEDRNRKAGNYSMGMKQRLGIAGTLLTESQLLVLDEPTNGLDPQGIVEIRELIIDLNKRLGKTIFISSHLLNEIEKMCTHVGIIHQGKGLFEGTISELANVANTVGHFCIETSNSQKAAELLKSDYKIHTTSNNMLELILKTHEQQSDILRLLIQSNISVYQAYEAKSNLEEMFIHVTENK